MNIKKRFLAMVSAAAMCLSVVPVSTSAAEDTSTPDTDWIPSNFQEAMDFDNTYGATQIKDGVLCLVFRESGDSDDSYDIVTTTDVASECFHDIFEYEDEHMHVKSKYEVVAYKPFSNGAFDVALNRTSGDVTREKASYQFYVDEKGEITETDLFAWVPDCITEYNDFVKNYGKVSLHENHIVYCAEVNSSTGASLIMEQNGTAEIKEILKSDCSKEVVLELIGTTSYFVEVYQPVSDGTVDVSWKVGQKWDLEHSIVSDIEKKYEVSENGTSIKEISTVPDDNTQRISVVDYYTGELLKFPETVVKTISFQTGFEIEYVTLDGEYGRGIKWGPISEWDYYAQNPYVIDASNYPWSGFGNWEYKVADINLPGGYFLPDDYLEVIEYDNDSEDIYIKLKKTLSGDVNDDGAFDVSDVQLLQKWLIAAPDTTLANWKAADLCEDDNLNVFDLCLMKRELIEEDISVGMTPANMPVIVDDYGEITDNMKAMLWETIETEYPNVDFSDFTFVYEPEHSLSSQFNGYCFSIYYKDILIHGYGNINTEGNIYAVIVNEKDNLKSVDMNFIVDPMLFSEVDLTAKCLSKEEVISTDMYVEEPEKIIYIDYLDNKTLKLAYRAINVNGDGEYIIDAVTGDIIEYIPYDVIDYD